MNSDSLIACHECDLLHQRQPLEEGERAVCHRCGATLFSEKTDVVNRSLALNFAALILFVITISLPFLGIKVSGITLQMNLVQAATTLYQIDMKMMSVVIWVVLLLAPAIKIFGMLFVLLCLKFGFKLGYSRWMYYAVEWIAPWNMVEIFLIGILVTFVKLGSLAEIAPGVSFWAFIAFVLVMVMSTVSIDRHRFWDYLEDKKTS